MLVREMRVHGMMRAKRARGPLRMRSMQQHTRLIALQTRTAVYVLHQPLRSAEVQGEASACMRALPASVVQDRIHLVDTDSSRLLSPKADTACRLYYALAVCMRKQVHAERFVADVIEHNHLRVEKLPFYFFRVRASGLLADQDFRPKWLSHKVPSCNESMFRPFVQRQRRADAAAAAVAAAGGAAAARRQ